MLLEPELASCLQQNVITKPVLGSLRLLLAAVFKSQRQSRAINRLRDSSRKGSRQSGAYFSVPQTQYSLRRRWVQACHGPETTLGPRHAWDHGGAASCRAPCCSPKPAPKHHPQQKVDCRPACPKICFLQRASSAPVRAKPGFPTHPSPEEVQGDFYHTWPTAAASQLLAAPEEPGLRAVSAQCSSSLPVRPTCYSRMVWQRFSLGVYRSHGWERFRPQKD